ncbi:MAG: toprim domain-containing protein [Gemmatimonadales bacterium]|nr:toprim domain-containing protein [Gemmatimonadales bacterium]
MADQIPTQASPGPSGPEQQPPAAPAAAPAPTRGSSEEVRHEELYAAVVERFPLTDAHRAELGAKRGFTDDTITRCRFVSGGTHAFDLVRDVQRACQATDAEMVAAGLLAPSKKDGKLYANGQLVDDRVLIPYLRVDGSCYHVRPHKLGFKGHGIRLFSEMTAKGWAQDEVLIVTEGEFKAVAAAQLGYRALAVPGLSSFAGQHFERLEQVVKGVGHKRLVVLFDREVKGDPKLPNYKEDPRKRYDTEFYTWMLAQRLKGSVGQLPESWMQNGKIDIDGALAAGRTRAEFDRIVRGALEPHVYMDSLPDEAGAIVGRRMNRYLKRDKTKALKIFDSRHSGCGYLWEEAIGDSGDSRTEVISHFVLRLERIVHTDEQVERIVRVIDHVGEVGPPIVVAPADMSSLRGWRQWCAAHGDYDWTGTQKQLDAIWSYLHAQSDGTIIRRTALGGEIEPGLWLFQNGIITQGRYVAPRQDDGLTWIGRRGFEMVELGGQPRLLAADIDAARTLGDPHRVLLERLRENLGSPSGWLGIGWAVATLFSRPLFNRYKVFPLLYCMGEAGSGKTTFARWLMNGFFGISGSGAPMMSTEKSQYRTLAKRCSIAAWFDEFRESRDTAKHIAAFCSIYNRQAYQRARKTGDLQTDEVPVRGTLLLAGVVPPKDDQLLSRCVLLRFDADRRDNRPEDEGGTYQAIDTGLVERLNDLCVSALLRYDELLPDVMSEVESARKIFARRTGNARMALNYAMAVGAFHVLCGDLVDSRALLQFAHECMASSGDRLVSEHPLADFWDAVSTMAVDGVVTSSHLNSDGEYVFLWLPGVFQAYERNHRMRRGDVQFRAADVRDWIAKQPYWVAPPAAPQGDKDRKVRRDVVRRMNGPPKRVVVLRRDLCPQALTEALSHVVKSVSAQDDFDGQQPLPGMTSP